LNKRNGIELSRNKFEGKKMVNFKWIKIHNANKEMEATSFHLMKINTRYKNTSTIISRAISNNKKSWMETAFFTIIATLDNRETEEFTL
jgi:hypothetical protein